MMNEHCNVPDTGKFVSDDTFDVAISRLFVAQQKTIVAPHSFLWGIASFFVQQWKSFAERTIGQIQCCGLVEICGAIEFF